MENMKPLGMEKLLEKISNVLKVNRLCNWGIVLSVFLGGEIWWILVLGFIIWKCYIKKQGVIELKYELDERQQKEIDEILAPLSKITSSLTIWKVKEKQGLFSNRQVCVASTKVLFPFKTESKAVAFYNRKEKLYFLPDALFVIQGTKVGAIEYENIKLEIGTISVKEEENAYIPSDAQILEYRWRYEKQAGGPDLRYKDNPRSAVCLYGELKINSNSGFNRRIIFSNVNHLL